MTSLLYENSASMGDHQESLAVVNVPAMATEAGGPPAYPLLEGIAFVPQIELNACQYLNLAPSFDMIPHQTNFTNSFLRSILASIDSKDEAVSTTWLETLIDVIDLLPEDVIREKIFDMALKKSRSDNAKARRLIARLVGLMASKLNTPLLNNLLLDISLIICRDPLPSVRQAICRELPIICRAVGYEETRAVLLPEYISLCRAEEIEVRAEALAMICDMMILTDKDYRLEVLLPIAKEAYEAELKEPYTLLPTLARHLGRVCHVLRDDLSAADMDYFVEIYRRMSKIGLQRERDDLIMPDVLLCRWTRLERECRHQCSFNLPAFVLFVGDADLYESKLHDILTTFMDDPYPNVCIPLAHGFHQICSLIGSKIYLLKEALIKLLQSDLEEVVVGITANISEIFNALNFHGLISSDRPDKFLDDLLRAIMDADQCLCTSRNWRAHSELLRQISSLAVHLPASHVMGHVIPILRNRMYEVKALPCRLAAARSFVVCLRYLENTEYECDLCEMLIGDLCDNISFSKRMIFLRTCEIALQILSPTCFKGRLLFQALSLFNDPVPNIRRKLVELLPSIKCILSLPEDTDGLQRLNFVVKCLSSDETDRDVRYMMTSTMALLDQINLGELEVVNQDDKDVNKWGDQASNVTDSLHDVDDSFKDVNESFVSSNRSLDDSKESYEDATESPEGKNGPCVAGSHVTGTVGSSPQVAVLRPNSCRIPSYIASERRKSTTCAPELPPDTAAISRLSSMDVTDDEFLIDAGVGIEQRKVGTPLSSHPTSIIARQPLPMSSRIPIKDSPLISVDSDLKNQPVKTRIKMKVRTPRPVSGIISPKPAMETGREISLSHENLRTSFTRMTVRQPAIKTRKPITGRKVASCNSSPGGSRSSSPNRRVRLVCSASTSPCGSPTLDHHPPDNGAASPAQKQASSIPRFVNSKLPQLKVWK